MDDLGTVLSLNDSPHHGLTLLCLFSANAAQAPGPKRRCVPTCRASTSRTRNVKHYPNGDFSEVGHRACEGDVDTVGVMRAYAEGGCHRLPQARPRTASVDREHHQ
ncbi:MAG: mannonate dehydratase [Micropruina glycogenica]